MSTEKPPPRFALPPEMANLPRPETPEPLRRLAELDRTQAPSAAPAPPQVAKSVTPEPAPLAMSAPSPPVAVEKSLTPRPAPSVPPTANGDRGGIPTAALAGVAIVLLVVVAVGAGAILWEPKSAPEPAPEPIPAQAAPAPAPPPPAEPEPKPEPIVLEWDALGPKIATAYGIYLERWTRRGEEPPTEADKPAVIAMIRTTGYADQDLELTSPDGEMQASLTGKSLPERELMGDVVELPAEGGAVEVFTPVYTTTDLALVERWTLDGTIILNKQRQVSPSFCYGLRSTTKLPGDTAAGAVLTLALLPADGTDPLAERTWTVQPAP